tara:strand:+ start:1075 stop:1599 length:525 start_codon:yes stop_codon:yes gene_type:complete
MAQTDTKKYTVQEKLNKMDIDVLDITLTTDAETIDDNHIVSSALEIENAVAVPGGTAVIQSICVMNEDDSLESPALEFIFAQLNTAAGTDEGNDIAFSDADIRSNLLGSTTVTNWSTLKPSSGSEMASKTNIGLVVKAAAGTTSLYLHVINRSGAGFTPSDTDKLRARIGVMKD